MKTRESLCTAQSNEIIALIMLVLDTNIHNLHTNPFASFGTDKENLFQQSRVSLVGDHFLYSYYLNM